MRRFVALATISAAILAYEVLLTRLFAIIQWHHFAFLAISIALLGFGASGAALAIWRQAVEPRIDGVFSACALAFAVTSPVAFLLAQWVPFNALELVWDPAQLLNFGIIHLLLTVPFTVGAACIGVAFLRHEDPVGRVYFWNLLGSAIGALGVILTLSVLSPIQNLAAVSALALIASVLELAAIGSRRRWAAVGLVVAGIAGWALAPAAWTALNIAEHKGLSVALNVSGTELVWQRLGPLGLVSVVESETVPFRSAPGLSLNAPALPPRQVAVFTDADAMTVIDGNTGGMSSAYLRYTTDALAYHLVDRPQVLVLGAGGGRPVAQALVHGAVRIDAVEANPDIVNLVRGDYAAFAGQLYDRDEVWVHVADGRGFLAATDRRWDVINVEAAGSGGAGAGTHGLNEDYLLTVDAIALMLQRLRPGGWLSFTQPLKLPPRAAPKLMVTALAALEQRGATAPADHLILIRGMATTTLLVGRDRVTAGDIAPAVEFAEARSFDLAYYPGMVRDAANRFNVLASPAFFDAAMALAGPGRDAFIDRYKFDIAPATDDRPYFHDFFRWRTLPELLAMRTAGGAALLELGELILIGGLGQAMLFSLALILLPLHAGGLSGGRGALAWRIGAYFTAIGLAFFFVEIAFIQKFILYLGHPTYAVAIVLAGFMVFAGLGARTSEGLAQVMSLRLGIDRPTVAIDISVAGLVLVAVGYLLTVPTVFATLSGLPIAGRALVSLTFIAPLAFFMGMPFPLGLTIVKRANRALTPWAWGVNGCASVIGAILAILLAMHLGYVGVVTFALVLYVIAALVIRGVEQAGQAPG